MNKLTNKNKTNNKDPNNTYIKKQQQSHEQNKNINQ